jgi:hypothetical protein
LRLLTMRVVFFPRPEEPRSGVSKDEARTLRL